ncbi:porin, partial [Alcanivorax sp.]|uniref:OmpP1/FadL family transporter n=1 Tax=Alcanivorax sp. TaxID=1872427 RepID=UPI00258EC241
LAAFHGGATLSGGLLLIHPESKVTTATPNAPTTTKFQGKDNVLVPNLSLTYQINNQLTLAFNTSVPLGLSTQYPAGAFSALGTSSPTKTQVEVVDFSPSLAFRVGANTAVAVGVDYYWVNKVAFNTASLANEGDGTAWGWNISASHVVGPLSFGVSFRSHAKADIKGSESIGGLLFRTWASTALDIPWRAQVGIRYQVNPQLALEADVTRTGWSSFDVLRIQHGAIPSPPFPAIPNPITSHNHWKDVNAYRLGGTYQLTPDTELRLGYTFDKTGMPDSYFSARIADADRHLFSIGLEKQLGGGLAIEGGYMLVKFRDHTHAATGFTVAGEPNGSLLYNGKYKSTVHLFGIGVTKQF